MSKSLITRLVILIFSQILFVVIGHSFQASIQQEIGHSLGGDPSGLSSWRTQFELQNQVTVSSKWSAQYGFSAWNEAVYALRPTVFDLNLINDDSSDLRLRNAYLEYVNGNTILRAGNQQVVWGDALGFSKADLINPKDLRNGSFHDITNIRMQIPILNLKQIFGSFVVQAIYVPKPYFNLLPSPGNRFAFPYAEKIGIASVRILREKEKSWSPSHSELGLRASYLLDSWDLTIFFFDAYDRSPTYKIQSLSASEIILSEQHSRVKNYGLSLTKDFSGYLLRMEAILTNKRRFASVQGTSLETTELDNMVFILGLDLPTWQGINTSMQITHDQLDGNNKTGLLRQASETVLFARIARTINTDHELSLLQSFSLTDQGFQSQFSYIMPLNYNTEIQYGFEFFGGPSDSQLELFDSANRIFVNLQLLL